MYEHQVSDKDVHGDTFSVDGGKIGIFEEGDEVCLGSFLESHDCGGLETEIGLYSRT